LKGSKCFLGAAGTGGGAATGGENNTFFATEKSEEGRVKNKEGEEN